MNEHHPAQFYRGPVGRVLEPVVRRSLHRGLHRRFPLLTWKAHRALWLATRSNRTTIAGHDMLLDAKDSLALASGVYEPGEKAWYESVVRPGDLVVEVGANIGFFALILARLVGPQGRVVSYEPDPMLHEILERNVRVNGYADRVTLRRKAVADHDGTMTFYRAPRNQGDNRLHPHESDDVSFPVDVTTLDGDLAGILEPGRRIDLLKMDIQGAEPLALAGFAETLKANPPRRVLMEFWPGAMRGMGQDPHTPVTLLREAGYRIAPIDAPDTELDLEQAVRTLGADPLDWVNVVCVHESETS